MEYLAFGLLGLGAIFILIGILSSREKKPAQIIEKAPVPPQPQVILETRPAIAETIKSPEIPAKNIKVAKFDTNALLFSVEATLYSDKGGINLYEGSKPDPGLVDTSSIHRIGHGEISFDGFNLFFRHKTGKEIYKLADLDRISFYPNCIALRKKQSGTTFLFFIDNTLPIKVILEQHLMIHAT